MRTEVHEKRDAARRRVCELIRAQSHNEHLDFPGVRLAKCYEIAVVEWSVGVANDLYGPQPTPDEAYAAHMRDAME